MPKLRAYRLLCWLHRKPRPLNCTARLGRVSTSQMAKRVFPAYYSMCTKYKAINVFYVTVNWEMKASAAIPGETWGKAACTSRGKELEIVAINGQEKRPG